MNTPSLKELKERRLSIDTTAPQDYDPDENLLAKATTLTQLADALGSDKGNIKHRYSEIYERYFQPLQTRSLTLAEIGVACGASLKMWSRYFPSAQVIGIDIRPECASLCKSYPHINIQIFNPCLQKINQSVDILIDDGSHVSKDILDCLLLNFDCVKPGGYYVIEDLSCTYNEAYRQGFTFDKPQADFDRNYFMQALDAVLRELDKRQGSLLEYVHFYRELCIIKKAGTL